MAKMAMSDKTKAAEERASKPAKAADAQEHLPMGRREQMPSDGHSMSNHNNRGNSNLRGKNLAYATRKAKA